MGEEQFVPYLRHHPWLVRQWPWAMSNRLQNRCRVQDETLIIKTIFRVSTYHGRVKVSTGVQQVKP
jgi:hypothetical protein